jgi:hypothetical protein
VGHIPTRPGRQAEAHAAVQPLCVAGRRAPWVVALGRIGLDTVHKFKILFSDLFNPRNGRKILEFVENCRNVQKLQTKFYWNYLEKLYRVGLIKLIFMQ